MNSYRNWHNILRCPSLHLYEFDHLIKKYSHVGFCWYSDLMSHKQTHTHKHKDTHMNNSLISKIYFPQSLFFSKIIHLLKPYLLIRCYKTRFFLCNTNNTDRNGVNKQNSHTSSIQRKITLERAT